LAFTLSDLLWECYKRLGQAKAGVVDSGSVSTIVDAMQSSEIVEGLETDAYNNGGIFVLYDAAGLGAAPQGQFNPITSFDSETGTFGFDDLTVAPAAGDKYGFTTTLFPFLDAIEHANSALKVIGDVETVDSSTLTTDSTHSEYPVAVGWKRNVYRVDYQGNTSDADDNQWIKITDWEYIPGSAGVAGKLILPRLSDGLYLRVSYMGPHGRLSVYNDEVDESIDPEYAVQATVVQMLEAFVTQMGENAMDTLWPQRLSDSRNQLMKWEMKRPMPVHRKKSKTWIMGDNSGRVDDTDDITVVSL
jgi:hypothetical protein